MSDMTAILESTISSGTKIEPAQFDYLNFALAMFVHFLVINDLAASLGRLGTHTCEIIYSNQKLFLYSDQYVFLYCICKGFRVCYGSLLPTRSWPMVCKRKCLTSWRLWKSIVTPLRTKIDMQSIWLIINLTHFVLGVFLIVEK